MERYYVYKIRLGCYISENQNRFLEKLNDRALKGEINVLENRKKNRDEN